MLDLYEKFYGLSADPFRLTPDHRFSFYHPSYAKAKAYLQYALHRAEGFIMITGRPGTGKTTLINELLSELKTLRMLVASIVSTQLAADDLLRLVAFSFGLKPTSTDKAALLHLLDGFLTQQYRHGRRPLLIVDEAQDVSEDALEELRLLTNLQIDNHPLLQIFLLGQEGLQQVMQHPGMEQLHQRLIAACHLNPLTVQETSSYIEHRLCRAGWKGDPSIDGNVIHAIQQSSCGIPRRINLITSRLLLDGALEQRHSLDIEAARGVIDNLHKELLFDQEKTDCAKYMEILSEEEIDALAPKAREIIPQDEPGNTSSAPEYPDDRGPVPDVGMHAEGEGTSMDSDAHPAGNRGEPASGEEAPGPGRVPGEGPGGEPPRMAARDDRDLHYIETMPHVYGDESSAALDQIREKYAKAAHPAEVDSIRKRFRSTIGRDVSDTSKPIVILILAVGLLFGALVGTFIMNSVGWKGMNSRNIPVAGEEKTGEIPAAATGGIERLVAKRRTETLTDASGEAAVTMDETVNDSEGVHNGGGTGSNDSRASGKEEQSRDVTTAAVDEKQGADTAPLTETKATSSPATTGSAQSRTPENTHERASTSDSAGGRSVTRGEPPEKSSAEKARISWTSREAASVSRDAGKTADAGGTTPSATVQQQDEARQATRDEEPLVIASTTPAAPRLGSGKELKAVLLGGIWTSKGKPATLLPSELNFCRDRGARVMCLSLPQTTMTKHGKVKYQVEATLEGFSSQGSFQVQYRTKVARVQSDSEGGGERSPSAESDWQISTHQADCSLLGPNTVRCSSEKGGPREYRRSM